MPKRILFVYLRPSTFVREDLASLRRHYDVRPFRFRADRARSLPGLLWHGITQKLWLLWELPRADVVFGWFADYHMVLPVLFARLMGKPVVIVLGGFDCIHLPALRHGVYASGWRAPLARWVLRRADVLLPVAEALLRQRDRYAAWPEEQEDGLLVNVPGLDTRIEVLPTGYDPSQWPMGPWERAPIVRTVAYVDTLRTARVKGIDLFVEAARRMPEVPFEVVGVLPHMMAPLRQRFDPPANVRLHPPVEHADLPSIYAETSVYAQLSRAEGMPNVLCEAMLCGCVPVASRVYGNPAAVGDAGYLVDVPEPEAIAMAMRSALDAPPEMRRAAREQIATHFTVQRRFKGLAHVIDSLT